MKIIRLLKYMQITVLASFSALMIASARAQAPGDLDPTFGDGGIVNEGAYSFEGVAIQPDGKIIAASFVGGVGTFDIAVFRYNPDGSRDTTFDGDGSVATDIGGGRDAAHAVALQPDGKIVVGANSVYDDLGVSRFVVVRYNPDGSLDATFDGDGKVITFIGGEDAAHFVTLQPDGKILVAGRGQGTDGAQLWVVVRYNTNGSLDSSFGNQGKVTTDFNGSWDVANSVTLQPDGKIVVCGAGSELFTVVRYNPDGSLDASFDEDGKVTADSGVARSVAVQPDGKVIAAGNSTNALVLRRYNSNGSPDTTFDDDGSATIYFQAAATATSVTLQPDGKIIVAGSAGWSIGFYDYGLVVARYNSDGSRDTTFGDGGLVTMGSKVPEETYYSANGVAVDGQGRIVSAGKGIAYPAAVYRFLGGSRRSAFDFDGDGRSDISVFRPSDGTWYLQRSRDGFAAVNFGLATDKVTPVDFDGDQRTDVAIYRPSTGTWYWLNSSTGTLSAVQFGASEDLPTPADYDGDGRADISVFRPSNGGWYRLTSTIFAVQFGTSEDKPTIGDYDGDGRSDVAVFRPSNGVWYRLNSPHIGVQFGLSTDVVTPADFDGDGRTDIAVYRPSTGIWYSLNSSNGALRVTPFGAAEDLPTAADYDGDGRADISVFRPSNGVWYRLNSGNGSYFTAQFGVNGDRPTPAAFRY